ncbi:MAG: Fe-S cluster assembly ATPase SufC [Bdellovibrionales bacterium]|nr:Fe-S cluster assembly ATPase SufC [Bdellovibrionales bacterium]
MSSDALLSVAELHARIEEGTEILKGLNLTVRPGEVHAIMGANGSGKSTLANVLTGREGYEVTDGTVTFCGKDLLEMDPEERAGEGLFMAFQYPVELPGVNGSYFLRTALNAIRKYRGEAEVSVRDFSALVKEKSALLGVEPTMLNRPVNEGFSGGEKKKNEILQLSILNPKLAILDETDSGLDIDALQVVSDGVNRFRSGENAVVLITHYQRLLNYIKPDVVHVMLDGRIVRSGGPELALELEEKGYGEFRSESSQPAA